jgi:hypothetical protein
MNLKKFALHSAELDLEFESDSLFDIYKEMKRLKQDDKEHHDKKEYYVTKQLPDPNGSNAIFITEGKVYKRGNKYFFKERD